jgi:D-alanyl-D-alanine carboxypeptidase
MRAYVALRGAPSGQTPGKVPVAELNRYAAALGLTNTHFAQPGGRGTGSYSSALDLAALTAELENIRSVTKHTDELGVGRKGGVQLIAAVLGAPTDAARLADQRELVAWGFGHYPRRKTVRQGQVLATPSIRYAGGELALRAVHSLTVGLRAGQTAVVEVEAPAQVTGPIRRGARLGTATVVVDGLRAGSVALVAGRSVDAPGSFRKVRGWIDEHPVPLAVAVCAILIAAMLLGRQIRRIRKGKRVKQK